MTTEQTADLLTEVQALIRERERDGARGLADRAGPAEWADLIPMLEPSEVALLLHWLVVDDAETVNDIYVIGPDRSL